MTNKDYKLYGTKILNLKTQEIGLLICLWTNKFADGDVDCLGLFGSFSLSFCFRKFINFLSLHQTFTLTGLLRIALPKIRFATCVDKKGKRYNIELDNIRGFDKANSYGNAVTCEPVSEIDFKPLHEVLTDKRKCR